MPYSLDLSGCRAKLNRAREHLEGLRADIAQHGYVEVPSVAGAYRWRVPLRQKYEADQNGIVWSIESLVEAGEHWGLIVGDAVHNLRSALDNLVWQLALRKFKGVSPTNPGVIRDIQFPVVLNKNEWGPKNRLLKYMLSSDRARLKKFQPFKATRKDRARGPHALSGLAGFDGLNNVDKHRLLQVTQTVSHQVSVFPQVDTRFVDCEPVMLDGNLRGMAYPLRNPPQIGDKVFLLAVTPTGPNPQTDLEPRLACFIAVRETWEVLYTLETFATLVGLIITAFEPT